MTTGWDESDMETAHAEQRRLEAEVERLRAAGNALTNASMVCPEDVEPEREAWFAALRGEE